MGSPILQPCSSPPRAALSQTPTPQTCTISAPSPAPNTCHSATPSGLHRPAQSPLHQPVPYSLPSQWSTYTRSLPATPSGLHRPAWSLLCWPTPLRPAKPVIHYLNRAVPSCLHRPARSPPAWAPKANQASNAQTCTISTPSGLCLQECQAHAAKAY
jgi:hypothetical protein